MTGLEYTTAVLEVLGVNDGGEGNEPEDDQVILRAINRMIDSWSADLGPIFAETQETLTLTSGDESYTLGSTGDLSTTRPVKVLAAYIRESDDSDYELKIVPNREFQDIRAKDSGDVRPRIMSVNMTNPDISLLFYPVPDSNYSLRLTSLKPLSAMVLNTEYAVPPGYEDAIVYNAAVRCAPIFHRSAGSILDKSSIAGQAYTYYQIIEIANMDSVTVDVDPALPASRGVHRSWQSDD